MNIPLISRLGIIGSAVRGDLKFAMIATGDIAAKVAELLVARDFEGTSVRDLLGPRDVSLDEATVVIGREINRPGLKYVRFGYNEAASGMREMGIGADAARLFVEMSKALNDGLFCVGRPRTPQNTTPTTIEEFATTFAEVFGAATMREAA